MQFSHVIRLLVGSTAIYLALALSHGCGAEPTARAGSVSGGVAAAGGSYGTIPGTSTGKGGTGGTSSTGAAGGAPSTGSIMDPVPDANANESGSRLKAKWYGGADGSKQWIGWYDSQRKEDCAYARAQDGQDRCLPLGYYDPTIYGGAATYYSDASCAQSLVQVGCPQGKYVVYYTGLTCTAPPSYSLHVLGSVYTQTTVYAKDANGVCKQYPVIAGLVLASIGPEIPPTEFVAATTTIE